MFSVSFRSETATSYYYYNVLEVLTFLVPTRLGMDFVIIDPRNPNTLYDLVTERFDMMKNMPEEAIAKPLCYGYMDNYYGGCE